MKKEPACHAAAAENGCHDNASAQEEPNSCGCDHQTIAAAKESKPGSLSVVSAAAPCHAAPATTAWTQEPAARLAADDSPPYPRNRIHLSSLHELAPPRA